MKLRTYLSKHEIPAAQFAERLKVTHATVCRYRDGSRIPRPDIMARIVSATVGAVGPADFYPCDLDGSNGRGECDG